MWRLALSWVRIFSSKLEFIAIQRLQKYSSSSQPAFWYVVLFDTKIIVLHHGDKTFLFYFDICIKHTHIHFVKAKLKKLRILKQKEKNPGIIFLTEIMTFATANTVLQLNLVFIADSHTGFCSRLLWKLQVKRQEQPLELFCKKRYSLKFCKFHRKTSVLKSLFNRVFRIAT